MLERLPAEAGIVQAVPQIVHESNQVQRGIFDRLRNRWTALLAVGTAAVALAVSPAAERPAYASSAEPAIVGMPFEGNWAYSGLTAAECGPGSGQTSHPSCHEIYSGNWSTDLYAAAGAEVKLKVESEGDLSFAWDSATGSCGETRRIKVYSDNTYLGRIHLTHLSEATDITNPPVNGMVIGKVANLACNPGGPGKKHVHMEVDNASATTRACYVNYSNQIHSAGHELKLGDSIGVIGSNNAGTKEACASLPEIGKGQNIVSLAGNWVGGPGHDLLYATKHGSGTGTDFAVHETTPTGIVWHSRGWIPGINFDEAKFIPNDMDGDGKLDILYATPHKNPNGTNKPTGFDIGYLRNDGTQLVYGGTAFSAPSLKLSDTKFLPGNWTGDGKGDLAYVTPILGSNPQKGIGLAVLTGNGSQLIWNPGSLWWTHPNLVHETTKYVPTDVDGNGKLDLLYASNRNDGGFDMALQVNTGNGFLWAGPQWSSSSQIKLKETRFIPGFWASPTRQGFAYVTKVPNSDRGFAMAVMDMTPTGMVWRGIWWPDSNLYYNDVKFIPADVDNNGYTDLFYASSKNPASSGFILSLQINPWGDGLFGVGPQWDAGLTLTKTKFIPSF